MASAVPQKAAFWSIMQTFGGYLNTNLAGRGVGTALNSVYYDCHSAAFVLKDEGGGAYTDALIDRARSEYRSYMTGASYNVAGFNLFSNGFLEDVLRAEPEATQSRTDIGQLMALAAFSNGGDLSDACLDPTGNFPDEDPGYVGGSRETSYNLESFINAQRAGITLTSGELSRRQQLLNFALGHCNQWLNGSTRYMSTFMTALTAKALIDYYEYATDATTAQKASILQLVQALCDRIWTLCWKSTAGSWGVGNSFIYRYIFTTHPVNSGGYYSPSEDPFTQPDLNNLISPMFAWVWYRTGGQVYKTRFETIFQGGISVYSGGFYVSGAFLGSQASPNGKHINQNLYWIRRGIQWAELDPANTTPGDPLPDPEGPQQPPTRIGGGGGRVKSFRREGKVFGRAW